MNRSPTRPQSVGCTTLILACNGFAGNSSLVAKYLPDVRGLPFAGHDGSQGDALAYGHGIIQGIYLRSEASSLCIESYSAQIVLFFLVFQRIIFLKASREIQPFAIGRK